MRSFHILIVEDDPLLSKALKAMLADMSFRNIDVAENGFAALRMLISSQYDLILLDNQMPVISGLELLRRCKSGCILDWTTVIRGSSIEIHGNRLVQVADPHWQAALWPRER